MAFVLLPHLSLSAIHKIPPRYSNADAVTLNSEMDFYLRNGRNGDFFTKWSLKIQFNSLSGTIFYVNIKVRHAYHLIVLFQVF